MTTRKVFAVAVLAAIFLYGYRTCGGADAPTTEQVSPERAAQLLIDRNWMDVWPESKTERLHVYRFVPSMGGGVYQDRTLFKGTFELFTFSADGDTIEFDLPETDQKLTAQYRIERVDGPAPFDLRLVLEPSPRGPGVYYGRSAETAADGLLPLAP